jgi:hypothetical protein
MSHMSVDSREDFQRTQIDSILEKITQYDWQQSPEIEKIEDRIVKFSSHGVILTLREDGRYEFDFMPFKVDVDISSFEGYNNQISHFFIQMLFTGLANLDNQLSANQTIMQENPTIYGETIPSFAKLLRRYGLDGDQSQSNGILSHFQVSVTDFRQIVGKIKKSRVAQNWFNQ